MACAFPSKSGYNGYKLFPGKISSNPGIEIEVANLRIKQRKSLKNPQVLVFQMENLKNPNICYQ